MKSQKVKLYCRILEKIVTVTFWYYDDETSEAECDCGHEPCFHIQAAAVQTASVIQREGVSEGQDPYRREITYGGCGRAGGFVMEPPEKKG